MPTVLLRLASLNDVPILRAWDKKQHVIDSSGTDDHADWPAEINFDPPWREILIAETDHTPIGALVIIDPEFEISRYWGNIRSGFRAIDIWIGEEDHLGKGYGTAMMRLAIQRCFWSSDVDTILINPLATNTRAIAFYKKMKFEAEGHRTFGKDACFVLRLERTTWRQSEA